VENDTKMKLLFQTEEKNYSGSNYKQQGSILDEKRVSIKKKTFRVRQLSPEELMDQPQPFSGSSDEEWEESEEEPPTRQKNSSRG